MNSFRKISAIVIALVVVVSVGFYLLFKGYYNYSINLEESENVIKLNVGDQANLFDFIDRTDIFGRISFDNNIFDIDNDYNIMALQEGVSKLKINFINNDSQTLFFDSFIPTSNVAVVAKYIDAPYDTNINGDRCNREDGNTYHIISCQSRNLDDNSCIYDKKNGKPENGVVLRRTLSVENNCVKKFDLDNARVYPNGINGDRCYREDGNVYHIVSCQTVDTEYARCIYDKKNNKEEHGTVIRTMLRSNTKKCSKFAMKEVTSLSKTNNSIDSCVKSNIPGEGCLFEGSTEDVTLMKHNTELLQNVIDKASRYANDFKQYTIKLPKGTFYFIKGGYQTGADVEKKYFYVIEPKSNVKLEGVGEKETILKPYGIGDKNYLTNGLDMFTYVHYATDSEKNEYLKNVSFSNFTVDSDSTRGYTYDAGGKGFFIILCDNCEWDHITVKNTDGTCFGMDELKDTVIKNSTAMNCGKNAGIKEGKYIYPDDIDKSKAEANGASGFGIGAGYADDESVYIKNCNSVNNAKFGYFFEHQNRFGKGEKYNSKKSNGFVVDNCKASGNLINYGGIRSYDVIMTNNESNSAKAYDVYFTDQSRNIYVDNIKGSKVYEDVEIGKWYEEAITWANSKGISIGRNDANNIKNNRHNFSSYVNDLNVFGVNDTITRAEAALMIWRYNNSLGEVVTLANGNRNEVLLDQSFIKTFKDVDTSADYAGAIQWLRENKIVKGTSSDKYTPLGNMNKQHFLYMLYRMEGYSNDSLASKWAVNIGIIDNESGLNKNITRAEAVTMIYRYHKYRSGMFNYPNYEALKLADK